MTAPVQRSSIFIPAIVAPTFNNARTLCDVLRCLDALAIPTIVIDDGSTDDTGAILRQWTGNNPDRHVRTHRRNLGKAAALQSGFAVCRAAGFTHAISIDTDGQHAVDDVPRLIDAARANPAALVLGARDESCADYPSRSRWGRRISNLCVRLECGQRVEDSQCGLRVYPLREIENVNCSAGHFGYETEVITRACWHGVAVVGVRVECRYLPPAERVSHFKPWRDSMRALAMHARLLSRSLLPWHTRPNQRRSFSIGRLRRHIRESIRGINPLSAWRMLKHDEIGRTDFALGFAIGVFIANLPLYGVQALLGLFTAKRLHLNALSVVAGTQISTPPIGPALIAMAVVAGHALLHGTLLSWGELQAQVHGHLLTLMGSMLIDWIVGSVCVGGVLAIVSFIGVRLLLAMAFGRRRAKFKHWSSSEAQAVAGGAD